MKKTFKREIVSSFLLFISLISCDKSAFDFDKFAGVENWNPTLTTPVLKANISISKLIESPISDSFSFTSQEDGTLYFKYLQKGVIDYKVGKLFGFPEAFEVRTPKILFPFPVGVVSPSDVQLQTMEPIEFTHTFKVDLNTTDAKEIDVYKDYLHALNLDVLVASNGDPFDGTLHVALDNSTTKGSPLTFDVPVESGMGHITQNYTAVILNLIKDGHGDQLILKGSLDLDHIETYDTHLTSVDFTLVVKFSQMIHQKIECNLGYVERKLPDMSTEMFSTFWNRVEGDAMAFIVNEEVPGFMKLFYKNSIGSSFKVNSVYSVTFEDKGPMESDEIDTYIDAPATVEDGSLEGSYNYVTESGVNLGSNLIKTIFISQPFKAVSFSGTFRNNLNPTLVRVTPESPNFITPSSGLSGDLEVKLPFYFRATETAILDTMNFDHGYNFEKVDRIKLLGTYKNAIPMGIRLELVPFNRKSGKTFTHMVTNKDGIEEKKDIAIELGQLKIPEIDDGSIGSSHRPTSVSEGNLECELSELEFDAFKKADAFIIRTIINTQRSDHSKLINVIVHSEDYIEVNLGMRVVTNMDENDL
ncbi:hypothetical protein K4L44_14680 [Halosquirtibacter laminarini]|uniref:Uncharacterized protein n=1 Tax=Halosquirtibacter laminarini TaxID=3374600 RepID=A0AC61NN13_9BACT|nr:hypothetical protein K4L44_14680 [Prolixibacteraceae bacterium]